MPIVHGHQHAFSTDKDYTSFMIAIVLIKNNASWLRFCVLGKRQSIFKLKEVNSIYAYLVYAYRGLG